MVTSLNSRVANGVATLFSRPKNTSVFGSNALGRTPGLPSLALDFTNGNSLDSRITFTRASSATYFGSDGLLKTAANDAPRFDYDPVTLQPKGLLIEEQRTNIILNSQAITLATWGSSGNVTFTANSAVAPDGTQSASAVMETSAVTATHTIGQIFTVAANTTYAASIYLKANGRDQATVYYGLAGSPYTRVGIRVNLTTGTAVIADVGSPTSVTMRSLTAVGNGWYRVTVAGIADTTFTAGLLEIRYYDGTTYSYTGDPSKGMYIWGGQVELGAFPTSYIPTTTAQVTRAADVATMTGANFSSWYNQSEGTFVWSGDVNGVATTPAVISVSDGSDATNLLQINTSGSGVIRMRAVASSATQVASVSSGVTASPLVQFNAAFGVQPSNYAISVNGSTPVTQLSGMVPTVNQLRFLQTGSGGSVYSGHIKRLAYYPKRLSNTELQAITS